jgi:ribonucleotide monophosphatase NagD (HAD superfamily)
MMGTASEETVMIGDNLKTDIPAGSRAGVQTVLLLTGVSRREEVQSHNPKPDWVIEDFAELRALFDSEFC